MDCEIRPLAQHSQLIARIADIYEREWPDWYGSDGPGDAQAYLKAACGEDSLPVGLLAFVDNALAGTVVLGGGSAIGRGLPGPWISSLLVFDTFRGRGVAAALIASAEMRARSLGFDAVYIGVTDLEGAVVRRGYLPVLREQHDNADVAVLCKSLEK